MIHSAERLIGGVEVRYQDVCLYAFEDFEPCTLGNRTSSETAPAEEMRASSTLQTA
jgi:hypothetical protein